MVDKLREEISAILKHAPHNQPGLIYAIIQREVEKAVSDSLRHWGTALIHGSQGMNVEMIQGRALRHTGGE